MLGSPVGPRGKASTVGHPQMAVHHALAFGQSRVVPHLRHHIVYGFIEVHLVLPGSSCVVSGQYGVEGNLERCGVALRLRALLTLHFTPPRFGFFALRRRDQNMRQHQHHQQLFVQKTHDHVKNRITQVQISSPSHRDSPRSKICPWFPLGSLRLHLAHVFDHVLNTFWRNQHACHYIPGFVTGEDTPVLSSWRWSQISITVSEVSECTLHQGCKQEEMNRIQNRLRTDPKTAPYYRIYKPLLISELLQLLQADH